MSSRKNNSIVALDAATGKEIWTYSPGAGHRIITNRGINYWESKDRSDRRLLFASNHLLRAIDARTGKPIASFGNDGSVDLKEGLGRDPKTLALVQSTTPGRVFENLLILGSATNQGYGSAPGDMRAFDVRTGKLVWTFHTIPQPGEFGYDTWPKDAWKTRRRRQRLGRNLAGREARHRVRADGQRQVQFLRRRPHGAESLRRLPAGARRPHRQTHLALPDGAPRYLGLRRRHGSETPDGACTTARRSTPWRRSASRDSCGCSIA